MICQKGKKREKNNVKVSSPGPWTVLQTGSAAHLLDLEPCRINSAETEDFMQDNPDLTTRPRELSLDVESARCCW